MDQPLVMEIIKAENGEYLNLEGHAVRMDRTMRRHFRQPFVQPTLPRLLPAPPPGGRIARLTVLYSETVLSAELSPFAAPEIGSLALVDAGPLDYSFKSVNRERLRRILEFSEADEAIIVKDGFVTNATTANLVFRDRAGALFTPLHYVHSGTKRESLIRVKAVTATPIKADALGSYETVYLVNAMLDIKDDVSLPCSEIRPLRVMPPPDGTGSAVQAPVPEKG
jgi:4-amino-4-deoxychorismate lyase